MAETRIHAADPLAAQPELNLISTGQALQSCLLNEVRQHGSVKIFAAAIDRTLGDFLTRNIYAAAVKMHFSDARLAFYYRDDRPYKKDLVALNPYIDQRVIVHGDNAAAIDLFYDAGDRHPLPYSVDFRRRGLADPDILLVPSMMIVQDLLRFDRYPTFQIPTDRKAALEARLVELGLNPDRWLCCIYYRQGNFDLRGKTSYRDVDDRPFESLARHVVENLGGQVVRLGHSTMRPWDIGRGFVDLSRLKDEFMTQATAVSLARFMISTSSGPGHLPGAFDVPYAITNTLSIWLVWKSSDLILPGHLIGPDGTRVDLRRLVDNGLFNHDSTRAMVEQRGFRLVENTSGELCALADMLHGATTDCAGWRRSVPPSPPPPPNFFGFPQPYRRKVNIVEFPQHWPRI